MKINKPISNYDEFIQLRKKLKKHKKNPINENTTVIKNEKFILTCIEKSSFKKISNNLHIYQKFYFNFYNSNDKNEVMFTKNQSEDNINNELNKTNDKSDNLISTKKEEETLVKHNNKRNLTDEEKLEEIFKNKVMINIVG